MNLALIDIGGLTWWWLLAIPVVALLLWACHRLMTRVRWLRDRKLTVCILLSVIAHAVLLTGAYMAKLFEIPNLAGDGSIRVTWEEPTDDIPRVAQTPAAFPILDATPVQPPDVTDPELEQPDLPAPDFAEPDVDAPAFDQPVFDSPDSELAANERGVEAVPEESPSTAAEPLDVHDPPAELDDPVSAAPPLETPVFSEPTIAEVESEPPPMFQMPDTTPPTAAESLLTADADAEPAPVDSQPQFDPVTPTPSPTPPRESTADHQVADPWSQQPNTHNDASNELVPVQRKRSNVSASVNPYRLRTAPDRFEQIRKRGGDTDTEAAVAAAQQWLAASQENDGRWDASQHQSGQDNAVDGHYRNGAGREADTAITGLAVLCFLASGNTHVQGEYRRSVAKGLEYLMGQQSENGSLAGNSLYYARTYCHGIATLALSEAYTMTSDERLRPFLQRAVSFTLRTQHPVTGGWRYRPEQTGDMSQFGWQVMALVSADHGGLRLSPHDRQLLTTFLRTASTGKFGGLASYRPRRAGGPAQRPSRSMTAEAMVCRVFLGQTGNQRRLEEAINFIAMQPPSTGPMNLYYWYYGTIAMSQYGGPHWEAWNTDIKRRLLGSQRATGKLAGSWDPHTVWGSYGGRVYSTAMAALCLEVYYRYLPLIAEHRMASRP